MIYLLFGLVALLSAVAISVIGARKGIVKFEKFNIYKPYESEEKILPYKGKSLTLMIIVCFVLAYAIQLSLYMNTSVLNFIKLFGLFVIVTAAGLIDSRTKIIPNLLIVVGLVFRAVMYVFEYFFVRAEFKSILINDLIGFAIGFVFLALVSLVSRGALGFGDAKLFGVIGLISGSFCTYSTLLLSLIISAVVSIVSIVRKKMTRKDTIPFGPCIAIGYAVVVLLTSY